MVDDYMLMLMKYYSIATEPGKAGKIPIYLENFRINVKKAYKSWKSQGINLEQQVFCLVMCIPLPIRYFIVFKMVLLTY